MINKKKFLTYFLISFAAAVIVTVFMLLVVFRGMFYNIYKSKGKAKVEAQQYTQAIEHFNSARKWKKKRQEIYLLLADAYAKAEDFDSAGSVIDEAIKNKITTKESGLEELYIMRIKIYTSAGRLSDAANYIGSLEDQYIRKKIEAKRPADLSYTPRQGSYDRTQKMTITVREGETVYYTTDGSYPTSFSNIYVDPITIANGITRITAVSVNAEGLVSPVLSAEFNVTNDYEEVVFDDPKMEHMVRASLEKPNGIIRVKELENVVSLSNNGIDGYLRTLSDLELMPNLKEFHIENETKLISVSQLSGRTELTSVSLVGCELDSTDINALGSLTKLQSVNLTDNNITSVSVVANLPELQYVFLGHNNIEDISPLASLSKLLVLDVSQNGISELPDFSKALSLEALYASKNSISDLSSIHTAANLITLDLASNAISNAKNIGKLSKLETLIISSNSITNFDFAKDLTALYSLDVSNTSMVSTASLSALPLVVLNANNTGISTIKDIANITTLTTLEIANTGVTSIEPLAAIPNLDYLDISNCALTDASSLADFKGLYTLRAIGVTLPEITYANTDIMVVTE